jgi:hypothetical protein
VGEESKFLELSQLLSLLGCQILTTKDAGLTSFQYVISLFPMYSRVLSILLGVLLPLTSASARSLAGSEWRPPGTPPIIQKCLIFPLRGIRSGRGGVETRDLSLTRGRSYALPVGYGGASVAGNGGSVFIPEAPCTPPPPGLFGINLIDPGPNIPRYCGEGLPYSPSSASIRGGGVAAIDGGVWGGEAVGDALDPSSFIAGRGTMYPLLPLCTTYQLLRHDQRRWQY